VWCWSDWSGLGASRRRPVTYMRALRGALCRLPPCGATRTLRWICASIRTRARPLSAVPPTRRPRAAVALPRSAHVDDADADAAATAPTNTSLGCEHFASCPGCVLDTRLDAPPVWHDGRRFFAAHQLPHFRLYTGAWPDSTTCAPLPPQPTAQRFSPRASPHLRAHASRCCGCPRRASTQARCMSGGVG
jgi:hypothetical protein